MSDLWLCSKFLLVILCAPPVLVCGLLVSRLGMRTGRSLHTELLRALPRLSEHTPWFRTTEFVQSLSLREGIGTAIYNSFLSEDKKLANRIINYSVNHLMVVSLLQEFSKARAEAGFPSLFLAQEGEAEGEEPEAQPVELLFPQLPFLPISF